MGQEIELFQLLGQFIIVSRATVLARQLRRELWTIIRVTRLTRKAQLSTDFMF